MIIIFCSLFDTTRIINNNIMFIIIKNQELSSYECKNLIGYEMFEVHKMKAI